MAKCFVFICVLLASGRADGFAWNSKLDYPNPVVEAGGSEDDEPSDMLSSQDQAIKSNSNDSIESSRLDSSNRLVRIFDENSDNVQPSDVHDQDMVDAFQIN